MKRRIRITFAAAAAASAISISAAAGSAGYQPVGEDGITASPKVRQMLNERPRSTAVTKAAQSAPAKCCGSAKNNKTAVSAKAGSTAASCAQNCCGN